MKKIVKAMLGHKEKTVPILSFPSTQLLGIGVNELIAASEKQGADGVMMAEPAAGLLSPAQAKWERHILIR